VRIKNLSTGHVFYARTHDHSRMGVETVGSAEIVTTLFDAPVGLEPGPSELVVVANGIPSVPITINANEDPDCSGAAPSLDILWPLTTISPITVGRD
jgi:hypothetical protein